MGEAAAVVSDAPNVGRAKPRRQRKVKVPAQLKEHDDPATNYAREVAGGKVKAGRLVYEACRRHLADLSAGVHLWSPDRGDRFAEFCRTYLSVVSPLESEYVVFDLLPWQAFCAYSIFGWRVKEGDPQERQPGSRRYRAAQLLTAKGSGKSPFGAALGLYMITADTYQRLDGSVVREKEPQCYAIASTKEQAQSVVMSPAAEMLARGEEMAHDGIVQSLKADRGVDYRGGIPPTRIYCTATGGFLEAHGSQMSGKGLAGKIVHYVQWEEIHEQTKSVRIDALTAGFKMRVQPLLYIATNAGNDKTGLAWAEREKAADAIMGIGNDAYFGYIAECDKEDIPAKSWYPREAAWGKANPSLGVTIRKDYIKDMIAKARVPTDRDNVLRLNFSIWTDTAGEFMSWEHWQRAERDFDDSALEGARLYLGVDLAQKVDMTALAYLWKCVDGKYRLRVKYYTPAGTLRERDRVSTGRLLDWVAEGLIVAPEGSGGTLDYRVVARDVAAATKRWRCDEIAIDPYHSDRLMMAFDLLEMPWWSQVREETHFMAGQATEIVMHSQTYQKKMDEDAGRGLWMESSITALETMILGEADDEPQVEIETNPVLRWNLACACIRKDTQGNRRWDKKESITRAAGQIDGLVASCMAAGLAAVSEDINVFSSPWEDPNYRWEG